MRGFVPAMFAPARVSVNEIDQVLHGHNRVQRIIWNYDIKPVLERNDEFN